MLPLLADATAIPTVLSADLSTWVGMIGTLGFATWYGYYTTAVTIPKINADNNALVERLVTSFKEEMKLERQSHESELALQRAECKREVEWMMAAFQSKIHNDK